jgi:hypothetical protein
MTCYLQATECDCIKHVQYISKEYYDDYCHYVANNIIQKTPEFIPFVKSVIDHHFVDFDAIDDHNTMISLYENNPDSFLLLDGACIEKIFEMVSYLMDVGDKKFYQKMVNFIIDDNDNSDDDIAELIYDCHGTYGDDNFLHELITMCDKTVNLRIRKMIDSHVYYKPVTVDDVLDMISSPTSIEETIEYLEYQKSVLRVIFKNYDVSRIQNAISDIDDDDLNDFFEQFTNSVCRFQSCPSCRTDLVLKPYKLFIDTTSKCPVCLDTIKEPHALECGHVYCKECLF